MNMADARLAKGMFWIVDRDKVAYNAPYCVRIPCNPEGQSTEIDATNLAKSGDTYNHERYWKSMPKAITHGKPFDYYPRGRVEIAHGKATIYLNPHIAIVAVEQFVAATFGLTVDNGVTRVITKADGSKHYRCYLD